MDNVYEVYYSNEDTPLVKNTKARIEWICKNVQGNDVLDIGCSQGINTILLGREGKSVIGIDVLQEAIDFAESKLVSETEVVQEKVRFIKGDFLQLNIEKRKYDTVIMTEVLEHLEAVEEFVSKARECLKEDGIAIISVPFGINDYWDHKRTYYLGRLYEHLKKDFVIEDITYIAKWLGVVCKVRSKDNPETELLIDIETLLDEENAFFEIERYLVDDNKRVREYNKDLKTKVDKWYQETLRLKGILAERKDRVVLLNNKNKEYQEKKERQIECLEKRLNTANTRLESKNIKYEKLYSKHQELSSEYQKKCDEYNELHAQYEKISNMIVIRLYNKICRCFAKDKT